MNIGWKKVRVGTGNDVNMTVTILPWPENKGMNKKACIWDSVKETCDMQKDWNKIKFWIHA